MGELLEFKLRSEGPRARGIWACHCGCVNFRLYSSGSVECPQCGCDVPELFALYPDSAPLDRVQVQTFQSHVEGTVNAARTARKVAENEIATELPKLLPAMLKTILEKNPSLMVQCLREHPYLLRTATEEVNRTLFGGVADKMVEKMMQAIQSDAGNGNGAG